MWANKNWGHFIECRRPQGAGGSASRTERNDLAEHSGCDGDYLARISREQIEQ